MDVRTEPVGCLLLLLLEMPLLLPLRDWDSDGGSPRPYESERKFYEVVTSGDGLKQAFSVVKCKVNFYRQIDTIPSSLGLPRPPLLVCTGCFSGLDWPLG